MTVCKTCTESYKKKTDVLINANFKVFLKIQKCNRFAIGLYMFFFDIVTTNGIVKRIR